MTDEPTRWKYRVVYMGGDGAMEIYWTNSQLDAIQKARAFDGILEGPLGDNYWGPK